jgi:hypothetical protein
LQDEAGASTAAGASAAAASSAAEGHGEGGGDTIESLQASLENKSLNAAQKKRIKAKIKKLQVRS